MVKLHTSLCDLLLRSSMCHSGNTSFAKESHMTRSHINRVRMYNSVPQISRKYFEQYYNHRPIIKQIFEAKSLEINANEKGKV